jgi:hypothetical protein
MYYVLYDKGFNPLGKRKTYPCNTWSLTRKANEFDELTIEGLAIENDDNAEYVGLHEDYTGELRNIAFAGVPVTNKGKTKINAVDIRQLLNNDCIIDLLTVNTVTGLYSDLLTCLFNTSKFGYTNIGITLENPDLTELSGLAFKSEVIERSKAPGNVWNTLQVVNAVYDCYISTEVDFFNKSLKFKVNRINKSISINLSDFDTSKTTRDATKTNRAVCYQTGAYTNKVTYYLLSDDTVTTVADTNKMLFPPVIEIFEDDDIEKAKADGIKKLYENRYKASVEIPYTDLIKGIDLNYMVDIYDYKKLPVMQIKEDNKNKKTIKLGRLDNYWWV